jgi:DNA-binding GntR family transcriptional regulator
MIQRRPLRDDVQREILERIADRRLPAAGRINESHLSAAIGVSRTPLREAMLGLEAAGFLVSDPGRGFLVPALSAGEFRDMQQVLAQLSPAALALAPPPDGRRLMELQNLLGRLQARGGAGQPLDAAREAALGALALRWSGLTAGACPNQVLTGDIARLEALCVRYWREAARHGMPMDDLLASYGDMYEMLRTGRRDEAARHWTAHIERFAALAAARLPQPAGRA